MTDPIREALAELVALLDDQRGSAWPDKFTGALGRARAALAAQPDDETERYKADYLNACKTIALMHEAATGRRGEAPWIGVVEDCAAVRHQLLAAQPVQAWAEADAVDLAHRAGFAGTHWHIGPEELVHLLNMVAAQPAQELPDCRLCQNFTTKSGGCVSVFQCVDANMFKSVTHPCRYWKTTETP